MKKYQVVGIGNALVDVLTEVEDAFLVENNIEKGIMQLVEREPSQVEQRGVPALVELAMGRNRGWWGRESERAARSGRGRLHPRRRERGVWGARTRARASTLRRPSSSLRFRCSFCALCCRSRRSWSSRPAMRSFAAAVSSWELKSAN